MMMPRIQWIAYVTILNKEVTRFMRIWPQTLLPSAITQTLYFLIFGKFIGSQIRDISGISYVSFIVPGLVMMAIINNSFANVVSSFFSSKFQRSVEELLVSPTGSSVIMLGYISGGVLRGCIVGVIVFFVSIFFTHPAVYSFGLIIVFAILTSIVFALAGLLNGILARKFDDISIFPTFILTPLIYLGGVFYSINDLPVFWQLISRLNPVLYMVNGFRYGFYGVSDVEVLSSVLLLTTFVAALAAGNLYILRKGIGLKS